MPVTIASVILPACNEAQGLPLVLAELKALNMDLEIIVVDDGSTDGTGEAAKGEGIKVLRHPLRLGAGRSVKDGISAASCDRIIMLDADGTYPVQRIPDFITELDKGFDLVVGARRGKEYWGSFLKTIARFVFKMIAQFATGKRIPDINSGMRAFRKSTIEEYFPHLCNGFSLPTTMTLAYFFTGKMVSYIPIDYHKRIGKTKVRIIMDSLRTLQYITESIVYFNPIKLFLLISILVLLIGAIAGLFMKSVTLFTIGCFFAALIFALGLVAHSNRHR
jgi:glycosyltransferase involved in cell wall biosynthesis